ncbi:MAG: HPr kinase/phosphorylase [Pyrinomonadaceae bacterium]
MTEITDWSKGSEVLHGTLVSVAGTGVLIVGEAGSGKSDCALALLHNGDRLVADDVVAVETRNGDLFGRAPDRLAGLLAVAGLGIIDIREVFCPAAYQSEIKIDVCVELAGEEPADPLQGEYLTDICGISTSTFRVPNSRSRPLAQIILTLIRLVEPKTRSVLEQRP